MNFSEDAVYLIYGFSFRFSFALVLLKKSTLSFSVVDLATISIP